MPFCKYCGESNDEDAVFCKACGKRVKGDIDSDLDQAETVRAEVAAPIASPSITLDTGVTVRRMTGQKLIRRFVIGEELGRGGMGVVYRARDLRLETDIAVKVLPDEVRADPQAIRDLAAEVRIAQSLSHPNIVRLHDFHETSTEAFLTMELINGPTLLGLLAKRGHLVVDEVLEWVKQLCAGLAYAHQRGVVHRDIKPHNVMLDQDGTIKICDFGIARVLVDTASRVSQRGTAGTLVYMSPEQYKGRTIDHRADIYATAAAVYHLLAGHPPFYTGDVGYQLLNLPPEKISDVPDRINEALLKGLAKEPDERFASIEEFGEAVARLHVSVGAAIKPEMLRAMAIGFRGTGPVGKVNTAELENARDALEDLLKQLPQDQQAKVLYDEVVAELGSRKEIVSLEQCARTAREAGQWTEVVKACRQWLELKPDDEHAIALLSEATLRQQELEREQTRQRTIAQTFRDADAALADADLVRGEKAIDALAKLDPNEPRLPLLRQRLSEVGLYRQALAAIEQEDGRRYQAITQQWPLPPREEARRRELAVQFAQWTELVLRQAREHQRAKRWEDALAAWAKVQEVDPDNAEAKVALAECERLKAAEAQERQERELAQRYETGLAAAKGENVGRFLAVISQWPPTAQADTRYEKLQSLGWEWVERTTTQAREYQEAGRWDEALSAWGTALSLDPENAVAMAGRKTCIAEKTEPVRQRARRHLARGEWSLAIAAWDEILREYPDDADARAGRVEAIHKRQAAVLRRVAKLVALVLAVAVVGVLIYVFGVHLPRQQHITELRRDIPVLIREKKCKDAESALRDLKGLVAMDAQIQVWEQDVASCLERVAQLTAQVRQGIEENELGKLGLLVDSLRAIDPSAATECSTQIAQAKERRIVELTEAAPRDWLAGNQDAVRRTLTELREIDPDNPAIDLYWHMPCSLVRSLAGHAKRIKSLAVSPDGQWVASGSEDRTLKIWRFSDGAPMRTLEGHEGWVESVAISSDGHWIVSGSADKTIKVWRFADGSLARTLRGHGMSVVSVAVSADGQKIVSGSTDNTMRIWRLSDGTLERAVSAHAGGVMSVALTRDGRSVVSAGADNTIRIWNLATGALTRTILDARNAVLSVDGRYAVSGGSDSPLKLWSLPDGALVRAFPGRSLYAIAVSPDGQYLVASSKDNTIKIWKASDGTLVRTLAEGVEEVRSVAASPDGHWIISGGGGADKRVKIWRAPW